MNDFPHLTLVIGGARSGKSRHAEGLARLAGRPKTYIATAQAWDAEMRARIDSHRTDRGPDWHTIEAPLDLPAALTAAPPGVILIDCATLWLTNVILGQERAEGARAGDDGAPMTAALTDIRPNATPQGTAVETSTFATLTDSGTRAHAAVFGALADAEIPGLAAATLARTGDSGIPVKADTLSGSASTPNLNATDAKAAQAAALATQTAALLQALAHSPNPVIIVTNELGLSIVPENALARRFRDAQGRLNQALAAQADLVVLVVAGLPLTLKGSPSAPIG